MTTNRQPRDQFVRVRGARENNLRELDVDIPRDALVVFTGVSGSGKSSLAFSTLYAEAQRRFLESVSPYARRLFDQMPPPQFDSIDGLPPAIALQQQRGSATTRSSVGSVTTLSNLLRMLYSRAGDYPRGQPLLYAESFSANTPQGACPTCQGTGHMYEVTERSMVPDDRLTIRQRAVAAWPQAWGGQNLRDILVTLGYDVDKPWRELSKKAREWILFTDDQPTVPVYAGISPPDVRRALKRKDEPSYMGTFSSARRHVLHTFASSHSPMMKRRAARYILSRACELCGGKRLRRESLSVTFAGLDITEMSRLSLDRILAVFAPFASGRVAPDEKQLVTQRIAADLVARVGVLLELGLGYLTLERNTPTLSPGELQRLRLATAVHSNLFGVVYVLDEPSAGLHPVDTEALLAALERLKSAGNSLFIVEHDLDVIRRADWIVDIGPAAGEGGGRVLYSGPLTGLAGVESSLTRVHVFDRVARASRAVRAPRDWLRLVGVTRNNLEQLDAAVPIGVFTSVTGVSGSGKSSLVSQALVELVASELGVELERDDADAARGDSSDGDGAPDHELATGGAIVGGLHGIRRLVRVDQKPIGRTPRSNLATYTGLFDHVRKLFAATKAARARRYDAGRFSFNMPKGRCATCEGEGSVFVEMLFLPSVYAPCSTCHGARYNAATLEIEYRGKSIADVLKLTVDAAFELFVDHASVHRTLGVLQQVGLGYLRLGQPATELSGGEAQRIKLATELQRAQRGDTLYVLDEPTTGLHPADVDKLVAQLHGLVDGGNTVVVVEHEMRVVADSDWVIDVGPGAGAAGGKIVVAGTPEDVSRARISKTAPYLRRALDHSSPSADGSVKKNAAPWPGSLVAQILPP